MKKLLLAAIGISMYSSGLAQALTPAEIDSSKLKKGNSMIMPRMYFLNTGVFFSPSMEDSYFTPALDIEAGFWKTNKKNFFSWGASAEAWYFTSIKTDQNTTSFSNNTVGFINLNGMFFYDNKILTPYLAPTFSVVSDFRKVGMAGGIAGGLSHKTGKRLETFVHYKYIKFSNQLSYLDMHFYMFGLSLKLSD